MKESDMYLPIKEYLTKLGYIVRAEVKNVDIVAKKGDTTLIIEMKKQITLKHLYQGCDRQRMFDNVYLAIFDPGYKTKRSKTFKEKIHILHRLRLGLILVDMKNHNVQVLLDPKEYQLRRNYRKKNLLLEEFDKRKNFNNIGGVSKKRIMTAYREEVIEIAKCLLNGPLSTKEIRDLTGNRKATDILYKNYYNWFERIDRGVYKLTDLCLEEIKLYI